MSELETVNVTPTESLPQPAGPALVRTFPVELTAGDGRTVDVRVVPYDVPAEVSDDGRTTYREEWAPGCFDDQTRAAHRVDVLLNFEHERGIGGLVGRGLALRSAADGLHGSFRIFDGEKGNIALELVREGILGSVSLEALPKRSVRTAGGVVRRIRAHLDKVALCRRPAFKEAVVLAVRNEPVIVAEELLPHRLDPALLERCLRLGVPLPGIRTHPAHADTPAEPAGTPD